MPVLYKNPNPMKKYTEITREEFELLKTFHRKTEWTTDEMNTVVNLNRTYVNPRTPGCLTCSGSFRDTLTQLRSFYLHYKDEIEKNLQQKMIDDAVESGATVKYQGKVIKKKKEDGESTKE